MTLEELIETSKQDKIEMGEWDVALPIKSISLNEMEFRIKIIPSITKGGVVWWIKIYSSEIQGPLYQTTELISHDEAAGVGIMENTRLRLNRSLRFLNTNVHLLHKQSGTKREKYSFHDLEMMMGLNQKHD